MIPYTGGSGNVPAWNTVISNGTGSGKLIGVHSSLSVASTATGAAMPAAGFIRVKQKTGTFQAGALTGITATASDAGRVGWIEIVGDEASTVNANRLGTFNITGAWYQMGITTGVSNQLFQIPNNGLQRYAAGVFVETAVSSGEFEFWGNAGTAVTIGTEAARGKVVWIDNTGLVRMGHNGTATMGYTPIAGLRVVIGNVFFENCTTAARTANVIPNATVATRYDFTTTGGGVVNIDKCNMAWYLSAGQAYSLNLSNSGFVDRIAVSEVATPMIWTNVGIGNKPTTALLTDGLNMGYCFAGGTFTNVVVNRVSLAASGAYTVTISDISDFDFIGCTFRANTIQGNATVYSLFGTRMKRCNFINHTTIEGANALITCDTITYTNETYINCVSGTTVTTYATYVWNLSSNTINCTFSGLNLPVTNAQPYTALLAQATGCANNKLRNIGTRAAPLNLGTTNGCGLIHTLATGCFDTKIQRVYCSNTRTGIMTGDNSSKGLIQENVWGDYADAVDVMAVLNFTNKGMGGTGALTAQTSVYGTHWRDGFTSTTAGRIAILMNEPTAQTASQVTLANGANFTSAGGLYMPVIGHSVTFEMPEYIIGHTGFTNSALVMAGGTATNYNYNYAIDKNDGAGWSAMTTANYTATTLGTALNGITDIDASKGFKLRLKITTTVTNTTAITSVYVTTTSTTTAQDYQYPLDIITLTISGMVNGSDIVILAAGTETVLATQEDISGTSYNYTYEIPQSVDIRVYKEGYYPSTVATAYMLGSSNASLLATQVPDVSYLL